jgi:hypothetical protein
MEKSQWFLTTSRLEEKQNGKEKLHGRACSDCANPREKPSNDPRELDGGAAQAQIKQLSPSINCLRDPQGLAAALGITPIFCAKAMKVGMLIAAAVAP